MKKACFLLLVLATFFSCQKIDAQDFKPDNELVYKEIDTVVLKLHIFEPHNYNKKDAIPAVIFFFGGGWTGGNPNQFFEQARQLSKRGILAMSAEYRIKKEHGTTPFESVKDAKSAIRWVREHASELGVDPNKIVASGGSAGGHVAVCTGVINGFEEEGEDVTISSVPNAMILYNPVLDTTEKGYGLKKVGEDRKTVISPNHHISENIVPTILFHGEADKTVPFENAARFAKLMKEAGNQCVLEAYKGKEHGFFNGRFFRGQRADVNVYRDIMKKTEMFLESLGYLNFM